MHITSPHVKHIDIFVIRRQQALYLNTTRSAPCRRDPKAKSAEFGIYAAGAAAMSLRYELQAPALRIAALYRARNIERSKEERVPGAWNCPRWLQVPYQLFARSAVGPGIVIVVSRSRMRLLGRFRPRSEAIDFNDEELCLWCSQIWPNRHTSTEKAVKGFQFSATHGDLLS